MMKSVILALSFTASALVVLAEDGVALVSFRPEEGKVSGLVCSDGVSCRAAAERTPDGDAALTFIRDTEPKPDAPAHVNSIRFNASVAPEQGKVYRLYFWAKSDRVAQVPISIALPKAPYTNFKAEKQEFEAGKWRLCELVWRVDNKAFTNNTCSLPLISVGHLVKGTELTVGPVTFARLDPVRRVNGPEWRPLKLDAPKPEYFKAKQIRGYFVKEGSVLDLSQYVSRYDIDKMGRIIADANGDLRFENAPDVFVRLRGDNCMYGAGFDGFEKMSDAELEELADQILRYGFNVLRFHFFDGKFAGKSGMKFHQFRNVDVSECPIPETYEELLKTIDKSFLDRFHRFTAALRTRGIYYMMDVFTSQTMYVKAGKNKANLNMQLFLDERVRNHWKAAYDFLMLTPNPYTGKRPIDDPQFFAITCRNEHEHVFGGNGSNTSSLVDFTPRFREVFGADMPEFSYALLLEATPNGDKARAFVRAEIAKMNAFFLDKIRASGWKGLVTHWDMSMRNIEGDSRKGYNAIAIHPYHAHPGKEPPPPGEQARWILEPWLNGAMQTVVRKSSICYNNYISHASMTRVLGKPLFVTEVSHCGANRYAQEEPVVLTAGAALQNWQLVTPHANLVQWKSYQTFSPYSFDGGMNPMARVASVAAAFGWQRGDIAPGRHAVSVHVPERVLASRDYIGAIGSAQNALSFVTRVGCDYEHAHNPCADIDLVPESFVGVAMKGAWAELNEQMRKNDTQRAAQFAALRRAGILGADNRTNPDKGLYESDTGQIMTDIAHETMTVDAPRFQAAALKPGAMQAKLSALSVERISTPASIIAISLDSKEPVAKSGHLLVIVATAFAAENSLWTRAGWNCLCDAQLEEGEYSTLMKTGQFRFSIKSRFSRPRVFAVNFDGTRGAEMPVSVSDGFIQFDWDTSTLEYATPYFEVIEDAMVHGKTAVDDASRMKSGMMNPGSGLRTVECIGGGEFKVLIYGNSIALHGPKPDIGWTNNWGMAASAPEKDFAHLVIAGLEGKLGRKADYRIRNLAALERNITTNVATVAELAADAAWKPDYVVIAIGENVQNISKTNVSSYRGFLSDVARPFAMCGSRIVMRSPFWRNPIKAECTRKAAADVGAAYVDASTLGSKNENKAKGLFWHEGVAGHPGDLGMRRLADLILAGFAAPRVARTIRPAGTGFCFNPSLNTFLPLNDDYDVALDGRKVEVRACRESRMPFNRYWPGRQRPLDQTERASYLAFEAEGEVACTVKPKWKCPKAIVRPLSAGVKPVLANDGTISFMLSKPGYYVLETDGPHKALHIFMESPRRFLGRDDATLSYGPGMHIAGLVRLKNHDRVYIDRDAIVFGCFTGENVEDVKIFGHGVIDGRVCDRVFEGGYTPLQQSCLRFHGAKGIEIDGPILMDAPCWVLACFDCEDVDIRHVKIVGQWRYNTDGIDICNSRRVAVRDCFVRSFDDTVVIKGVPPYKCKAVEDVTVERCVMWCGWSKTIESGIETWAPYFRNVRFLDCDLIRNAGSAINISAGGSAEMEDFLFENIRVEMQTDNLPQILQVSDEQRYEPSGTSFPALVQVYNRNYVKIDDGEPLGHVRNCTFRNIAVFAESGVPPPSIRVLSQTPPGGEMRPFENVTLEGFTINGNVADWSAFNFATNTSVTLRP